MVGDLGDGAGAPEFRERIEYGALGRREPFARRGPGGVGAEIIIHGSYRTISALPPIWDLCRVLSTFPTRRRRAAALLLAVLAAAVTALGAAAPSVALPSGPDPDADLGLDPAEIVGAMSDEQLIGQLLWLPVYGAEADEPHGGNRAAYGVGTPAEVVARFEPGGIVYFGWADNIGNPAQLARLSDGLQRAARGNGGVALAIGADQEGGTVARIGAPATELPAAMNLGAAGDPALAYAQGAVLGAEFAAMGLNVNFAPTIDVNTNPANPVIGTRSLGEDPAAVGALGAAQLAGMAGEGVTGVAKHFPGHGDTDVDSHTGLPVVTSDREELAAHLAPFARVIEAGVDIIMTAHIVATALDEQWPATLSPTVLTNVLREELGFEGIITTDALDMAALTQLPGTPLSPAEVAVTAVAAGADVLLMPPDAEAAVAGLRAALDDGRLTRERLEDSARRQLDWKAEAGILSEPDAPDPEVVGAEAHREVAAEIARRGTTVVRNDDELLPLDREGEIAVWGGTEGVIARELAAAGFRVRDTAAAQEGSVAVVELSPADRENAAAAAADLAGRGVATVVVVSGSPYDYARVPANASAVVLTYGPGGAERAAAAAVIAGDAAPGGLLPVTVRDHASVAVPTGSGLRLGPRTSPTAPDFVAGPGGRVAASFPAAPGVEYLVDGAPLAPGAHDIPTGAVVRARPAVDHWFAPDVEALWRAEAARGPSPSETSTSEPSPAPSADSPAPQPGQDEASSAGSALLPAGIALAALVACATAAFVMIRRTRRARR